MSIETIKKHWFLSCAIFIIALSIILRFYDYQNRWGLAYDQARDVLVAREALKLQTFPLIGPFASAGQFVYGPQWYWILMFMINIFPNYILTPWLAQSFLYVGAVFLMISIGKEIKDKFFGLLVGFLTAISPAQIAQSTNLTSPSMVAVFSIISLYFFIRYIKYKKTSDIFIMGFCIATAINIHFQAIGLLSLIPIALLLGGYNLKNIIFVLIGTIIPFIPLIIFDFKNNFFESKNMIDYYRFGQYRIYAPNRWLTYAGTFWPQAWTKIVGGELIIGYLTIVLLAIITVYKTIRLKFSKPIFSVVLSFLVMFIILRYYRGEKFDSYLTFFHPFVLILTGWVCLEIYKLKRILGIILIIIIAVTTLRLDIIQIKDSGNFTAIQARDWENILVNKFPNKKFAIYDYQYKHVNKSLPLVLFLDIDKKIDDNGFKLGLYVATSKTHFTSPAVIGNRGGYQLLNLDSSTSAELSKEEWAFVNPSQVYKSTVEWYKKGGL